MLVCTEHQQCLLSLAQSQDDSGWSHTSAARSLDFDVPLCAGCGKSTLMMVLFRMVEPCGGAILIDGLDTLRLGLTDLRCGNVTYTGSEVLLF